MIFAHFFIGVLLAMLVYTNSNVKKIVDRLNLNIYFFKQFSGKFIFIASFAIGSILPDLDLPFFILLFNADVEHRDLITHSTIPYIFMSSVFILLIRLYNSSSNNNLKTIFYILFFLSVNSLVHVVLDVTTAPSILFAPFQQRTYYFPVFTYDVNVNWFQSYLRSGFLFVEALTIAITLIFLPGFLQKRLELILMLFFLCIIVTSISLTLIQLI